MATQFVTYYLSTYEKVLQKSKAIEAVEGQVVTVKAKQSTFDDPTSLFKHKYEKPHNNYKLVAKLPMSAAIKLC